MMERFNFYDIYGYVLPGGFWLALLWLPAVLVVGFPDGAKAEIAAVALVGGYVAGHLLQALVRNQGRERYLSELLLDDMVAGGGSGRRHASLSKPVRDLLAVHIRSRFGVDVAEPSHRKDAFFLCRTSLIQAKAGSYVEQYQGMHSLMRGLAAALLLSFLYYLGWLLAAGCSAVGAAEDDYCLRWALIMAMLPAAVTWIAERGATWLSRWFDERDAPSQVPAAESAGAARIRRWLGAVANQAAFVVVGAGLAVLGWFGGRWYGIGGARGYVLAILASLFLFAFFRFKAAAQSFDESLAKAVYQDFVVLATAPAGKAGARDGSSPT
ncbi:MAG TPA: hypothetical protein VGS57_22970 [Thermoanaerobaculia bacterium]|jgi:hypothetical protein|nr:hypothetical protein [Thermoanaerobaculia bacterium]